MVCQQGFVKNVEAIQYLIVARDGTGIIFLAIEKETALSPRLDLTSLRLRKIAILIYSYTALADI